MPEWGTVDMIEPSRFDERVAYAAVERHKMDDNRPYIFETADGGKSWTRLGDGIPDGAYVHAVREDPVQRGLLYAATERGVYVSFDSGGHWQSLQLNLPLSPVHDLVVKDADLVVATHGRSFWILDDVTSLRQIAAGKASGSVVLYQPALAYRLYYPDEVDTRTPAGQNPPAGALIDYYFAAKPTGEVMIDIYAGGDLVRHLSSKAEAGEEQPPEWPDQIHPTNTLPANAGMNRFVWNLRYDDPVQIPGAFYEGVPPRGPIALPGTYTVKLTYEGQTQTAALNISRDPRVKGLDDGMRQKFALSVEVWHDIDALHRAVNEIRDAKKRIAGANDKLKGRAGLDTLASDGHALLARMKPIEEALLQVNLTGSEGNLNYPDMLNEQVYAFASDLEDADTSPTKQEVEFYAVLHKQLEAQLAQWSALKSGEVSAYEARLKQAGL
jgi:hypothetical protein